MTIAAGTRLGPYEVLGPLGAGGMGEVYRARDSRLSREVAIKVLPAELASDASRLKRFEKEARFASALNHPNIVTVYDIGSANGLTYLAMERVEGETLRTLLVSGALSVRKLLPIATQIAEGLAQAHEAGIVHRDLKPENLMVTKDGLVKILDFGLSKPTNVESGSDGWSRPPAETGTSPGMILGTVGYMSPEQASGEAVDFRSDQFSFGSILYEMATGKRAFHKKTGVDTLSAILNEEPEPIASVNPQAPAPLRWIVERCLTKEPDGRYGTTRDLARELANLRDHISEARTLGETLVPPRPSRTRLRFWTLAAIAAVILAVAGAYRWGLRSGTNRYVSPPSFHRLTFRRGELGNARFAPDGQTIVYSAEWEGERKQIYSTRLESPESRPLGFGQAEIVAISSAGEMAIELQPRMDSDVGTLARVSLAGGVPREVVENVAWVSADWSPDGKDLVVVRGVERKSRLEFPIGKVLFESPAGLWTPRFSPDGDRIAFTEGSGLAVIESSGKGKRVLSSGLGGIGGVPCWTPDGDEIWFNAAEAGRPDALYAVDLSGKRRLVARVPGGLELYDISRDGRVLMAHHTPLRALRGVAPGESKERDLSWLDASRVSDLSDDGRTLVMTEVGEGGGRNRSVYLRKTDGSPAVRLGEGQGMALSPDGNWVLARVLPVPGAPPRLVLLPTGAGESNTLEYNQFLWVGWANWLPDGKRILFAAAEPGKRVRLYLQELSGGNPKPVTPEGVGFSEESNSHAVSPDGKFVIGAAGEELLLYPVEGGSPRPIRGLKPGDEPIQWTTDGRALYVFRNFEIPVGVWLLDQVTGSRRLWKEFRFDDPGFDASFKIRVTPDGGSYVYSRLRTLSVLYLVEGLR